MIRITSSNVLFLALASGLLPCAFGYIGETVTTTDTSQVAQITRPDSTSLQFYLDSGVVAGATSSLAGAVTPVITASSNPAAAVETAMASWNNVGSANIHFNGLLPTTIGHNSSDCLNMISIATTQADLSILGFVSAASPGAVGVTANSYITSSGAVCGATASVPGGAIIDSDILLNPYIAFSTDGTANTRDVQAVITHEFGHVLGMNHSGLLGATMYPFSAKLQRHLSWDEKAFAEAFYPSGTKSLGTISGKVTLGTSPVVYALIVATELSGTGTVIGSLTGADGTFSVQAPPGTYNVYAEPFNSFIAPTNIYSLSTGVLNPTQATTGFQPTFSGGNIPPPPGPPVFTVTAGSNSTANISVVSGATALGSPTYAILPAGTPVNGATPFLVSGAVSLAAGQSYDIVISGAGIDSTISVPFIGTNVSVVGSARVDPAGTFGGNPIIRQTLSVGSQTNATLGSLWITKGTNILSLSGLLDIEPMTPTLNNVQDAESARTSITSGQWAAIYGNNLANNTRLWNANTDFTGGVAAGDPLPSALDGVSVTINSIPASVYLISPAQINILTPTGLASGPATVVVSNGGTKSTAFTTTVVQSSPSFFAYQWPSPSGLYYPYAVHLSDGATVGDPAVLAGTEKAHPGEILEVFVNGIAPSTGGVIATVTPFAQTTVTVNAGSIPLAVSEAYLVAAGEFQINVTLPSSIPAGNYALTMTVPNGSTSTSGITVTLPVGP